MSNKQDHHILFAEGKKLTEAKQGALDIYGADNVEVVIDQEGRKLWVNVSGWCALRVHSIRGFYEYIDLRAKTDRAELYERGQANNERITQERAAAGFAGAVLARVARCRAEKRRGKEGAASSNSPPAARQKPPIARGSMRLSTASRRMK